MPAVRVPAELIEEALSWCAKGLTPEQASMKVPGVSPRTIYRERKKREAAPKHRPSKRQKAAEGPPPVVKVDPVPSGLSGRAADLWIVEQEIEATRYQIAKARTGGDDIRIPGLQTQLANWMNRRRELRPTAPADPTEEDRRWRDEGQRVVARIESGVAAVEARLRKERAATG